MALTGPAAGADQLKTSVDPTGLAVAGTLHNCAGGPTPWGTVITGDENFNQYFANLADRKADDPLVAIRERYGLTDGPTERLWETFYDRFDLTKEPNEPLRFGWGVEIDPFDPASTPKKRTALGRNKHEGHTSAVAKSGQVVIYGDDDERFEYAYKFVTSGSYNADDRAANMDLLDDGTLYVARFDDDGSGEWLPLIHGENGLDKTNGFQSQADILIFTRAASDVLGATKMDRSEDFETNPVNGKVYLVCTNNTNRAVEDKPGTDAANPRPKNSTGHIIEITEDGGDPADESTYFAGFSKERVSPIASLDNVTFDTSGNLWMSTDGLPNTFEGKNDGLFAVPVNGSDRGYLRQLFSAVTGSEVFGPAFNPDSTSLWASIQHPGEGGSFETPITLWPDGKRVARPTVVLITKDDGCTIGG